MREEKTTIVNKGIVCKNCNKEIEPITLEYRSITNTFDTCECCNKPVCMMCGSNNISHKEYEYDEDHDCEEITCDDCGNSYDTGIEV